MCFCNFKLVNKFVDLLSIVNSENYIMNCGILIAAVFLMLLHTTIAAAVIPYCCSTFNSKLSLALTASVSRFSRRVIEKIPYLTIILEFNWEIKFKVHFVKKKVIVIWNVDGWSDLHHHKIPRTCLIYIFFLYWWNEGELL